MRIIIIRPHRSTTYVDVAYCHRPSSVVCWSVGLSIGLSVTLVSPAKTAAPILMPFGLRTRVVPMNHVLDGGPDPPWEGAILRGWKGHPIVKYRDTLQSHVKTAEPIEMPFGLWARKGPRNRVRWTSCGAEGRCHGNQFWD